MRVPWFGLHAAISSLVAADDYKADHLATTPPSMMVDNAGVALNQTNRLSCSSARMMDIVWSQSASQLQSGFGMESNVLYLAKLIHDLRHQEMWQTRDKIPLKVKAMLATHDMKWALPAPACFNPLGDLRLPGSWWVTGEAEMAAPLMHQPAKNGVLGYLPVIEASMRDKIRPSNISRKGLNESRARALASVLEQDILTGPLVAWQYLWQNDPEKRVEKSLNNSAKAGHGRLISESDSGGYGEKRRFFVTVTDGPPSYCSGDPRDVHCTGDMPFDRRWTREKASVESVIRKYCSPANRWLKLEEAFPKEARHTVHFIFVVPTEALAQAYAGFARLAQLTNYTIVLTLRRDMALTAQAALAAIAERVCPGHVFLGVEDRFAHAHRRDMVLVAAQTAFARSPSSGSWEEPYAAPHRFGTSGSPGTWLHHPTPVLAGSPNSAFGSFAELGQSPASVRSSARGGDVWTVPDSPGSADSLNNGLYPLPLTGGSPHHSEALQVGGPGAVKGTRDTAKSRPTRDQDDSDFEDDDDDQKENEGSVDDEARDQELGVGRTDSKYIMKIDSNDHGNPPAHPYPRPAAWSARETPSKGPGRFFAVAGATVGVLAALALASGLTYKYWWTRGSPPPLMDVEVLDQPNEVPERDARVQEWDYHYVSGSDLRSAIDEARRSAEADGDGDRDSIMSNR